MKRKSIISLLLLGTLTLPLFATVKSTSAATNSYSWDIHASTALAKTDSNFEFISGDYNNDGKQDMFVITKKGASNTTEIHVLNGADNFQSFLLHTASALHQTDGNWTFKLADQNKDGKLDLYAICKNSSGYTEVHVLNGADNFKSFLVHDRTALGNSSSNFEFEVGDYNNDGSIDLYAISKKGASNTTEVHVLNGANNFKNFLLHTATGLHQTNSNFTFELGYYDNDNKLDLFAINRQGSTATEVHVLSGSSNFKEFTLHSSSILHKTDSNFEFSVDRSIKNCASIFAINRCGTTKTEVHKMTYGEPKEIQSKVQVNKLLSVAQSQIGYKEGYNNYTKYGEWYGLSNSPWCAMFVSWCSNQSGISTNIIPKHASCSEGVAFFKNQRRFKYSGSYIPQPGDIIYFGPNGSSHVGIVTSVSNGQVNTIEGNTSDMVAKRSYSLTNAKIYGYGTPNYSN